jgi:hypothetical protein
MVESVQYHSLLRHIQIVYIECVCTHLYAVNRHMGAPLHFYTTAGQVDPELGYLGVVR